MTARLTTTLGALALGLAAFAASPVMAQGTAAAPAQAPAATSPGAAAQGMVRPMHHGHMASSSTHHAAMHEGKGHKAHASSVTEGDAAVAHLNEQSLMAAQKGIAFTPGAAHQ